MWAKAYRARYFRTAALIAAFGLAASLPQRVSAQAASAVVTGVVTDPSGAAVPKAQVQLTNVNTSVTRSTETNTHGNYLFLNVTPGTYTMRASASGFSAVTQPPVTLQVNQTANFDFHLKVGQTSTTVTVNASAAEVETATAELGTVVNTHEVNNLPLNGRNFTELLTITPGAANVNRDQSAGGGGGFVGAPVGAFAFPAINGARVRSNSFLLDGINDLNTFLTTYNVSPIIDDIQEFKVQGHNDEAQYGGVMGGIVSVVSKSGTNQYHGTLWEFLRNSAMDARGFFNAALPPLRQNQFGAAGGGPISIPKIYNGKDRTFFYAAYEGYRAHSSNEGGAFGPTDAMRNGDFSGIGKTIYDPNTTTYDAATNTYSRTPFAGNTVPSSDIGAVSQLYQSLVPHAGALLNGNNIYLSERSVVTNDTGSIRADQYFGNRDQLMFRYSQYEESELLPNGVIGVNNDDIYGHN
ncbi:MAG: carboxypeptidase regulatory-like domain-containing protein, partial [Candidatus Acidiferrales bacterium]